jgi:hypothetical protein
MLVKPVAKKTTRNTAAKKAVKKTTATVKKAVSPVTA